jgi:hypothetical protein
MGILIRRSYTLAELSANNAAGVQPQFTGRAWGMVLDNPSNTWLYIPELQRYIPSNQLGVVVALPGVTAFTIKQSAAPAGGAP